jgi:predicted RNA binding protein YcfA (HicA-like mRNA interferase family)
MRLFHPYGKITTIPLHSNQDLPIGLLNKIIKQDLDMTIEEFNALIDGK